MFFNLVLNIYITNIIQQNFCKSFIKVLLTYLNNTLEYEKFEFKNKKALFLLEIKLIK